MSRAIACLACSLAVGASAALTSVAAAPPASKPGAKPAAAAAVFMPPSDLKWTDVAGSPGVKMAVLNGDPGKGASHFFMKMPAGFTVGMHFHTADHWVAVISGTMMIAPEGGAETSLPAGSGFGFTGKKRHTTKCAEGADCVMFIDARGKWDVVPAEKK